MFPVNQENIILEVDTLLNKMTVQRRVGYSEEEIRCRCRGEEDTQKRRLLRNCFSSPNINHPSDCLGPSATLKNRTPRSCICLFLAPRGALGMRAHLVYTRTLVHTLFFSCMEEEVLMYICGRDMVWPLSCCVIYCMIKFRHNQSV